MKHNYFDECIDDFGKRVKEEFGDAYSQIFEMGYYTGGIIASFECMREGRPRAFKLFVKLIGVFKKKFGQ